MSSAAGEWKGVPTGQARAVDEQRHNEPKPVVPPSQVRGRPRPDPEIVEEHSSRRPSPGRTPPTPIVAGTPRAIARIESARDWQRYVVGKVLQSPGIPEDPDAGAGLVTATAVGARAGEPAARSTTERGGRLKHSGTHPLASVAQGHDALSLELGQYYMCTRLCTVTRPPSTTPTVTREELLHACLAARDGRVLAS